MMGPDEMAIRSWRSCRRSARCSCLLSPATVFARSVALLLLVLLLPDAGPAQSPVDRLLDSVLENERAFVQKLERYEPILETYIQVTPESNDVPAAAPREDHYMIGRLVLSEGGVTHDTWSVSEGFSDVKRFLMFFRRPTRGFVADGFAQMVLLDESGLTRDVYRFDYVRREFLGDVRCFVFDVRPNESREPGRFMGRVWVEDRGRNIVRFNGTYSGGSSDQSFYHFDSWRTQVTDDYWAPAYIYVEDSDQHVSESGRRSAGRFRAQTRIWGYNSGQSSRLEELTGILISSSDGVDDAAARTDISPLNASRMWRQQAQRNVIERLELNGLLAKRGPVDDVLRQVVTNLLIANDLELDVDCRVLLTTPLETFSVDQAIVISRGLLDVLPDEASLAMVLSDELAHILLGHPTETMYAFSDLTLLEDAALLSELRVQRSADEIAAAGVKAVELLRNSSYGDQLAQAGLFLKALERHGPQLPNLVQPNFGNQLTVDKELIRLAELSKKGPVLKDEDLTQIAALPLGSRIRVNAWSNEVALIDATPVAIRTARDKMPFEISPFMLHLRYLESSSEMTPLVVPIETTGGGL
jgi:hypothetical protein